MSETLTLPDKIAKLGIALIEVPQVALPVFHHFGPGIYIREIHIPAGTVVVGHAHKGPHTCILLKGALSIPTESGEDRIIRAPLTFVAFAGQKAAIALEDTIFQNVYATEERDVEKLEDIFLDKCEVWKARELADKEAQFLAREADRKDFESIKHMDISSDNVPEIPDGCGNKLTVRQSSIHGLGLFLSAPAFKWDILAPIRVNGKLTIAGLRVNHAKDPNAFYMAGENGDISLIALRDINGCMGGSHGEEITVDYWQAHNVLMRHTLEVK